MLQNRSVLGRVVRLLLEDTDVKCFSRTGADAVAAADTLHAVRLFAGVDIHLAGMCTGAAVDAFALIEVHTHERNPVEETVEGAKRAEVLAEGAVYNQA